MIRVVLADDHHLVRQGVRALLERAGDLQVLGEAADGQAALELVARLTPDVLVMDISMPRLDGTQALARMRALGLATRTIILSMHSDLTLIQQVLRAGAKGYLLKSSVGEELLLAIRAAHQGQLYLTPAVSAALVEPFLEQADDPATTLADQLSPREREVLQLIVEGHTSRAIAETLQVSPKTIDKERASLMTKLGVHDLAGLVRTAIKHKLVRLDD